MDHVDRLMIAAGRRARTTPGFVGHAIARWELRTGMHAGDVLGAGALALAGLEVTPMPCGEGRSAMLAQLARAFGIEEVALVHIADADGNQED